MKNLLKISLLTLLVGIPTILSAFAEEAPLNGIESSLTIYAYPPRDPIDWSTPESTLKSMINNLLGVGLMQDSLIKFVNDLGESGSVSSRYKSSMGHTLAHIRCSLPGGQAYDHWASFSGEDYIAEDKRILLKEKVGMGAMFHSYIDGHIIMGVENIKRITFYKGSRQNGERQKPRYIQYEVDAARCLKIKRMVDFFESFHFPQGTPYAELQKREQKDTLYFTNQIDPYDSYLHRTKTGQGLVGGGCAPFGAALVKIAGRYKPELEALWRTPVSVSEKLIGGQFDPKINAIRRVSISDILHTRLGERWSFADEGYADRFVNMYDPQKIWEFGRNVKNCLAGKPCNYAVAEIIGAERGRIQLGETKVFKDTVTKVFQNNNHSGVAETVTEKVEQAVEGFVWRLR